jgi:hypothetical protein
MKQGGDFGMEQNWAVEHGRGVYHIVLMCCQMRGAVVTVSFGAGLLLGTRLGFCHLTEYLFALRTESSGPQTWWTEISHDD